MNEIEKPITFCELLQRCRHVEIPLIQRDYAQGRDAERDVRDEFLKALQGAVSLSSTDPKLPLNLDFIYGSMEGADKNCFIPLDGQQRLTTLFLLHWYLAWRDSSLPSFRALASDGKHAHFTYHVRPSSREFFDAVVTFEPSTPPQEISSVRSLLQNQPWFFLHWRLDPTIQAALSMLDAIHERFKTSSGLYARLLDKEVPAITFHLLPLEHFGLTDDLYIKMNARGKPLTAFETFKARFEELLKELFPTEMRKIGGADLSVAEFFARRMDTQWTDFFWRHKQKDKNSFDDELMNLLWAVARTTLDPAHPSFSQDSGLLRNRTVYGTYTLFHEHGWLTRDFAGTLICLLEAWSGGSKLVRQLPDNKYLDESAFLDEALRHPAAIEYTSLVIFAGFAYYLRSHNASIDPSAINDWMRVVFNLGHNTSVERPDEYGRALAALSKLVEHRDDILQTLAQEKIDATGFSPHQVKEEFLKAKLLLADPGWKSRILEAEGHGYFSGQIQFLLDFSGASNEAEKLTPEHWNTTVHTRLQSSFDQYFQKAKLMFNDSGLVPDQRNLWRRALLATGSYVLPYGRNYSFLTNTKTTSDSWKRFLRDNTENRELLKTLWDRISLNTPQEQQLEQIITTATGLKPWIAAAVKHPEIISYCGFEEFRSEPGSQQIYLLKRQQMNGFHAELFSYALHQELKAEESRRQLVPLQLNNYKSVTMRQSEPYVSLSLQCGAESVDFQVFSTNGMFQLQTYETDLLNVPEVEAVLRNSCGFTEMSDVLARTCSRQEIHDTLTSLAASLAALAPDK